MRSIALVTLLLASISINAQVSKVESKIVKAIDANEAASVELLKKLVNMNSGTMNFEGVKAVGDVLVEEFKKLGMDAKMVPGNAFGRAGHLIATNNGKKGPKIMMIGHLDTVFEPSSPFQEYTMVNDSIMRAPGVADMKGGNVIILLALKGLKEAGLLDKMTIEVVMTGDEERSGSPLELSKKALKDAAERADIALGFENADGKPKTIVTSRRGSAGWELKVEGNAAHSSQIFTDKVGVGAIYEASRILNAFYKELSTEENLTFNPGTILGGTDVAYDDSKSGGSAYGKTNVVAKDVIVKGDIRAVSLEQLDKAQKIMTEIVSKNYPGTKATLTFDPGGYPPLGVTDGNKQLLSMYDEVSKSLGYGSVTAVNPRNAGAADVSFTAGLVDMAVDGLGLSGADDHTVNETGNLNMLPVQAKRAALLMYRLTKK
ncbi:M20/M25/M40 family metallo-hydrolase [Fulvivirga lutimaris]|uniref:M20/M25/M40 family metallo-hydrolase n=1 Tax=Fulvivirga lutimaris TaxID=1819566 RepID=UPI0012BB4980|nr:M20/M25/M40 family metallo-hydrolase [Fulvivirga lutimaris]MTI38143.1 M20 family peptidase [Fulvivirga lutimaris]